MRGHIVAVLVITLGLLVLLAGCSKAKIPEAPPPSAPLPAQESPAPVQAKPVEYQILPGERGNKDLSVPGLKRYTRDITVPYETTDEEIKPTLRQALNDFREVHPDAEVLRVRVAFEGATAMLHANVTWAPGGDWYPIEKKDSPKTISFESLAARPPKPVKGERFGLSLAKRQEVFVELARAEDEATDEAMARYPDDVDKQYALEDELASKHKAHVREKYNITEQQQEKIYREGFEQHWEW